jgi:hypothetical protein
MRAGMGRRTADDSSMEVAAKAARAELRSPSLSSAAACRHPPRATGVWSRAPSSWVAAAPCRGLRGGGTCVQHRAWRDEESTGRGVPDVGATARVWCMGRRHDGGGGGRWNGVGRGRRGAGGSVHRRNCAGDRSEARIGRWGSDARGEVSERVFFARASHDAAR